MPVAPKRLLLLSVLLFLVLAGSFITALFFKENLLWMDEILSYLLITDPSFTHLNASVVSGFEQTPPVFFNLYWLLGHAISTDVVFLKSVSIVLFAGTFALFYYYTTRLIGTPLINLVLITGLAAFTYLNITLAAQIRSYVPFLFISFLYFIVAHQVALRPTNRRWLLAHVGVGLLLTLTHNFGLFYLAASGGFFGLLWLWSRDNRYWYVLGTFVIIAGVWVVGWYPYFAIQAKAGEAHSWIPLPTLTSFFRIIGELEPTLSNRIEDIGTWPVLAIIRSVGLLVLFGYVALPRLKRGFRAAVADPAFMLYLLAGFVHVATIGITLAVTWLHTSLFLSRYLWPNHLLVIYQLLYAFYYLTNRASLRPVLGQLHRAGWKNWAVGAYLLGLAGFLFYQNRKLILTPTAIMAYVDQLDKRVPVFVESSINFMPTWFYKQDRPIYFLLDYASAFDPRNDPGATVGYHTLSGIKRQYNVDAVKPLTAFTPRQVPHFFVVDERWNYQIERFIANKSVRVVRRIPTTLDGFTILECVFTNAPTDKVAQAVAP